MKVFEATAVIGATPETIWEILTDAEKYTAWDSGILQLDGEIALGESIRLTAEVNPGRAFALKVADFVPPERMTWVGGMPLGLFRGLRDFQLAAEGNETRITVREEFTGPLLSLIGRGIPDLTDSFHQFVQGLKSEAERRSD
jgi:hypothetical protein